LYHLLFVHLYYFKAQPSKTQYREAVAFVVNQDPLYENSLIVAGAPSLDYYFERYDSARRVDIFGGSRWAMPEQKTTAAKLVTTRNPRYVWFICEHSFFDIEFTNFLADSHFALLGHKKFFELDVWLFENKSLTEKPDKA
jgi:hypothetical protein